jgi:hypothetical protein
MGSAPLAAQGAENETACKYDIKGAKGDPGCKGVDEQVCWHDTTGVDLAIGVEPARPENDETGS